MAFTSRAGSDKEDKVTQDNKAHDSGMETEVAGPSTSIMVKQEKDNVKIDDDHGKLDICEGQIYDIGRYGKGGKVADNVKYDVLQNVWTPEQNFNFPQRSLYGKNRCF